MTSLYVISPASFSGKSAICLGLVKKLIEAGFSVSYMKPISTTARRVGGRIIDEDAEFMKQTFELAESLKDMAPVLLDPITVESILHEEGEDYAQRVKDAYERVAKGKDVVILEGAASLTEGSVVGLPAYRMAELLDAQELVVSRYSSDLIVDELLAARELLGESMIGAVINAVPRMKQEFVEETMVPFLQKRGIPVFAVLPQEKILLSISVQELADHLDGRILCCPENADELVENLMVGAMSVDSALTYFRRTANKAVITGGDRPDIQLAALETSTRCLVLTGNLQPSPIILGRAEEVGVPIVLVRQDTLTAVEIIEQIFGKSRFHQAKKIHRFERLLNQRFDFEALY
ncbi:MAG: phosphotransacetylase family protein, partial [Anaerolineae bacterium]